MYSPDYADWSIKLLLYVSGVASTIVGSWVSSKIRLYHDARNAHRDELKDKILVPLRVASQLRANIPRFGIGWQAQAFNPAASVKEDPTTVGPALGLTQPISDPFTSVDPALLEDARLNHYRGEITACTNFITAWDVQQKQHHQFIIELAEGILASSGLPPFRISHSGCSVMHLELAVFIHSRLMLNDSRQLELDFQDGHYAITDRMQTKAKGTEEQMRGLLGFLDKALQELQPRAKELKNLHRDLMIVRESLLRKLSLAIAAKKLKRRCELVRFF